MMVLAGSLSPLRTAWRGLAWLTVVTRRLLGWLGAAGTLAIALALPIWLGRMAWLSVPRLVHERQARMVWSDYVTAPTGALYLWGWVAPPLEVMDATLVVAADARNHRTLGHTRRGQSLGLRLAGVEAGVFELPIVGTIYGPLAYCRQDVRVMGAPPDRPTWVLDARLADRPELASLPDALKPYGVVTAAHIGPGSLVEGRRQVQRVWPGMPVVGGATGTQAAATVRTFRRRLRRQPLLVTADPAIATQAVAAGAGVHLLGAAAPSELKDKVRQHADLEALKVFLASGPIGQ